MTNFDTTIGTKKYICSVYFLGEYILKYNYSFVTRCLAVNQAASSLAIGIYEDCAHDLEHTLDPEVSRA